MKGSWSLLGLRVSSTGLLIACFAASALAGVACKSDDGTPAQNGTDAKTAAMGDGAPAGGTVDASVGEDVSAAPDVAPPQTCAENESCAFLCEDDAACKQACSATLGGQEKALLEAVVACRRTQCQDQNDNLCRCEAECYEDGPCAMALDACTGGLADPWCDKFCH
jgi:hypothetical protein